MDANRFGQGNRVFAHELAGRRTCLFFFCACEDALDTKLTWQIGDSDVWRVPELAQGVLYKAYSGIANRPDCFEDNFLDCATDNAVTNMRSSAVYRLGMGGMFPLRTLICICFISILLNVNNSSIR